MHTFTYTPDPTNPHDQTKVVVETWAEELTPVLGAIETYLRAAGFQINGVLDVVDPQTGEPKDE